MDEYATLYLLEKNNLVANKDVSVIYTTGGTLARAAQMKQGLFDAMTVSPPNEVELEKLGFRELVNFFDLRMGYAGIPYTVTRDFRDKNQRVLTDFMTAIVEAIQVYRTNREAAYRAIIKITRQNDPYLLEKTHKNNLGPVRCHPRTAVSLAGRDRKHDQRFPRAIYAGGREEPRRAPVSRPDFCSTCRRQTGHRQEITKERS